MALYEYKCKECGEISEYLVFSSSDKVECKKCGSKKMEKQLSGFAVSVKAGSTGGSDSSCPYGSCCGGSC
ncbi:zinc ribbon domain-containing protein [Candidatus Latescibacterota bacterium]